MQTRVRVRRISPAATTHYGHSRLPSMPMPHQIHGRFTVTVTPQPHVENVGDAAIGRMSLDKQFFGPLDAVSKGQMLASRSEIPGSAGYVAMERVVGSLDGRTGTFVLMHHATMNRGAPQLTITVVPDSGTGDLVGLRGSMGITIVEKEHFYDFEYTIDAAK
jgi:hypothetical protein